MDNAVEHIDLSKPLEYSAYQNHIARYILRKSSSIRITCLILPAELRMGHDT